MLDEDLRAQLAELVRPVASGPVPDIRVLRRRARRRGIRRAAAAAAVTAVVAALAIGIAVSVPGTRPPASGPRPAGGGPGTWAAAPGTWTRGTWQPAGSLPAADAGPAAAPYVVLVQDKTARVRDVFTGRDLATVSPAGQIVAGVAAAGDDHTFILAGLEPGSVAFDELRLRPDGRPAFVRPLFTLPGNAMPAFAVSPDASMLAYTVGTGFETVSLATGTGRAWTADGGQAFSMSWANDRTLAFEWAPRTLTGNSLPASAGVRLLDVTSPGTMLAASRLIIDYCTAGRVCAQGPLITPDGSRLLATRVVLSDVVTVSVEEYSARTGRALAAVTTAISSARGDVSCGVLWTDPSGAQAVSYCGRAVRYDDGHVAPVSLHLPVSLLNAHGQVLAW